MGFFDLFRKKSVEEQTIQQQAMPEIPRATFVDDGEPMQDNSNAGYLTGMPIDAIYAFINRDYEQKGYDDAMSDIDGTYMSAKKEIIKNELKRLFEQVSLCYRADIRNIQTHIGVVSAQGLTDTASRLKARLETYNEHLDVIKQMEEDLNNNAPHMLSMIDCYERGFRRGITAKSDILLGNEK